MSGEINTHSVDHVKQVRRIVRYLIGFVTGLVGISDMLSVLMPRSNWGILLGVWPILNHRVPAQSFTVVIGFFLIMLSYGLARGKKHAWSITLVLLILSALLHVRRSGSVLATVVALLLALLLYLLARFFQARSDPPSVRRGYIALGLGLGIVTFYAVGGFIALYDDFAPWFDRIGIDGVILYLLENGPLHVTRETPAFFFQRALPALCISAILYGLFQLFRPVAAVFFPDHAACERVNKLVRCYGKNSISYFAVDEEKSYFFSESGRSVISYVLQGSTAVVAGDPIGPEEDLGAIIRQFMNFCSEQDWTIAFWQVRAELADKYREAGLHLLKIGEDAVIDIQRFTLKGGAMENVRKSVRRAEKDGLRVVFYRGRVTNAEQLAQMEEISREWLSHKGGPERGFCQGYFDPYGDSEQVYAVAVDANNKVYAYGCFVPIYGRHGWAFDQMRRSACASRGTGDLLFVRTIEYLRSTGAEVVSMGLAVLSNVNNENESFLASRIDSLRGRFGNPTGNQSLFQFKQKYQPTWESRYLAYSDPLNLLKIGLVLYRVLQGDASLLRAVLKSLRNWRRNRRVCSATAVSAAGVAKAQA
jgi:phosphatidylglycerol lysyltransferase